MRIRRRPACDAAGTWLQIGIVAGVAVIAGAIAIGVYRWLKIRERGE